MKQILISNKFPNYIFDEQIKRKIKNINQQNKYCNAPPSQHVFIELFTATKCTTIINYMKIFLKSWFKETYSPLILIKKKLIIYNNKFKTSILVIKNDSSPSIGVLQNAVHQFKCPL